MARFNWLGGLVLAAGVACGGGKTSGQSSSTSSGTTGGGLLAPGVQCISNASCASGVCDVKGAGNCCSHACSTEDPACGATDCDSTGACSYPSASTSCGRCSDGMFTPGTCDGLGVCANPGTAGPCPSHMGCNAAGTGCNNTCARTSDCASGYYCSSGACVAQIATGACAENEACSSGFCGVIGTGHCCSSGCESAASPCGAADCDDATGACVFAGASVACGATPTCSGNFVEGTGTCNGHGGCAIQSVDCEPFTCGEGACAASCADSSSCVSGAFCDVANASCCQGLAAGGTVNVDGLHGDDTSPCCGIDENAPCLTISRAMQLIDNAGAANVTINVTLGGGNAAGTGTWAPIGEKYPIVLGWGAEVYAPGITFLDTTGKGTGETFDIAQYSSKDAVGYASIAGSAALGALAIGLPPGGKYTPDPTSIQVESGQTLYLANATVQGDANGAATAIAVLSGGTLVLGQDQPGTQLGQVVIGQAGGALSKGVYSKDGWIGIDCQGCTLRDTSALDGGSSVWIQGQIFSDIRASDGSSISLTAAPTIGAIPTAASFNTCGSKQDGSAATAQAAVLLDGQVNMTFDNGAVRCIAADGFVLVASAKGAPTLQVANSIIQGTELGILAEAGTASVSESTIEFNYYGVQQDDAGAIDLSGGALGGTNTVVCSSSIESTHGWGKIPGVDVLNTTGSTLNASNVAWDTPGPDLFACDAGLTACTCETGICTDPAGKDGMDAVDVSAGLVTTAGNSLSSVSCTPICYGTCDAGTVCCTTSPLGFGQKLSCIGPGKACL